MQDKARAGLMALALAMVLLPGSAGAQSGKLMVGGIERSYRIHVPASTAGAGASGGRALVLILHGAGGTPEGMAAHTRFNRLADREGIVAVYPAAAGGIWHDGRTGAAGSSDSRFLVTLADSLRRIHRVDSTRIYVAGISNGASMAYRLACDAPGVFAAIGIVAGSMPAQLAGSCQSAARASVIALHGTSDGFAPYGGSRGFLPVPDAVGFWAARAGCSGPRPPARMDRVRDGTAVEHTVFGGCKVGGIELHTIHGGGHTWPGGPAVRVARLGRTTRELDASELLWEFFDRHPPLGSR